MMSVSSCDPHLTILQRPRLLLRAFLTRVVALIEAWGRLERRLTLYSSS